MNKGFISIFFWIVVFFFMDPGGFIQNEFNGVLLGLKYRYTLLMAMYILFFLAYNSKPVNLFRLRYVKHYTIAMVLWLGYYVFVFAGIVMLFSVVSHRKPFSSSLLRYRSVSPDVTFSCMSKLSAAVTSSSFSAVLAGAMARTRDKITNWGKLHDPLADKILIGVTGAVLITRYIGLEIILIMLILELLTVLSAIHLHDNEEKDIGARLPGKIKMIFQSFGLVLLLLFSIYKFNSLLIVATSFFFLAIIFSTINILLYKAL